MRLLFFRAAQLRLRRQRIEATMITKRTTPRRVVLQWLTDAVAKARAEKAELTAETLIETSEGFMAMTAACEAPEPAEMMSVVTRIDFPARALKYLERNWCLNTGLLVGNGLVPSEAERTAVKEAVIQAYEALQHAAGTMTDISGSLICDITERAASSLSVDTNALKGLHGEGTGILLREILGMPGDVAACMNITNPASLHCALLALEQLGIDVTHEAFDKVTPAMSNLPPAFG